MTVVAVNSFLFATHPSGPFSAPSPPGEGAVLTGAFADPNGNLTPTDTTAAAWYYQDGEVLVWWQWSVDDQVWYQGSG